MTRERITPLAPADLAQLASLWNAAPAAHGRLGDHHPLGERALQRWWSAADTDAGLTFALRGPDGALLGAALARAPTHPWADPRVGHVSLLVVARERRGRGHGHALLERALQALAERGRDTIRFGADPDHLLPGIPLAADDASWRSVLRAGAVPGGVEHDLRVDLRAAAPAHDPAQALRGTGLRLVDDDPAAALAFVERCFPGRWSDEMRACAAAGVTLLTLRGAAGDTLGFAAAHRPDDALLGHSLTWHSALPGPAGGLGPLGVDPEQRGRGLGLRLVSAGLAWHHVRGARDVILDWTTLSSFYGRLGARVWRSYQRAELVRVAGAEALPQRGSLSER